MKAIVVRKYGEPEVQRVEELIMPTPGPGQVLVRVAAAGVNPADTYARSGNYANKPKLPYTPGTDGAGIVENVGPGVSLTAVGDRVYLAASLSGTYAEYALALETQVHPLPERVSFSQGAAVFVPYATAHRALNHFARVRSGEQVLVHGASGSVGTAAIQFAVAAGLRVVASAGSDQGRELVLREGAHGAVNHRESGYREAALALTGGKGFDVILEMLANANLGADLGMLAPRGRVVVIGSRGEATINPRDLMSRDAAIFGMLLWNMAEEDSATTHAAISAGLESGALRPVVGAELPLAQAAQAHRRVLEPGAHGKIVLIP
ncbi:MAG: NADPH:quinone reductase [Rectinemataceae bacterium]|jgi:NADPH2:quinone reductase